MFHSSSLLALLTACAISLLSPAALAASAKSKPAATAAKKAAAKTKPKVSQDDAVRMQLFLDKENFGPGKIDGSYGGFTKLAWMHWQQAHGIEKPEIETFDPHSPQLAAIEPLYTEYTVVAEDLANLGPVPTQPAEQSKLKALAYGSLSELLSERFHCAEEFLKKINAPKKLETLKVGDTMTVPNVQPPFDLAQVGGWRDLQRAQAAAAKKKEQEEKAAAAKNGSAAAPSPAPSPSPDTAAATATASPTPELDAAPTPSPSPVAAKIPAIAMPALPVLSPAAYIHINIKECYLELRDGDRLVAAFPVTPGSGTIPTPVGEWKILGKALFPEFRWDKEMLMHGKRSKDAYELPPGPNSPVGIAWIALNKPGIGLHGTNNPETIGRAASHGCVRLANWDAFKLYNMVQKGMKVIIE